ncbi:MAG: hypothetical protein KDE31_12345, partial [Caldilineaceae bacterium]|nr:hypothetical protein [Caldilineaceae bacterium]
MSTTKTKSPHEALEMFKERHADLDTIDKILSFSEERFIAQYADFYDGDVRKARRAYHEACRIKEQITLLWANVKDAVASPYMRDTLFNNIPQSFIDLLRTIPGYNRLFGNLDFVECDHSRSIFGPAAYFVDLMRFIEKHIPQNDPMAPLPSGHRLEERQPRLFRIPLDHENTYTLIPYIDLINEVLEDLVRRNIASPYAVLADAKFPMQLPFHLPLEEIRIYLKQLKLSLQEIYRLFGAVKPEIAREILALSPIEYTRIENPIDLLDNLKEFYGVDDVTTLDKKDSLGDVEIFTEQTGLSRQELNDLLFLDLSRDEFQAGLSRFFFINNTGDGQGHLSIEENVEDKLAEVAGNFVAALNAHTLPAAIKN